MVSEAIARVTHRRPDAEGRGRAGRRRRRTVRRAADAAHQRRRHAGDDGRRAGDRDQARDRRVLPRPDRRRLLRRAVPGDRGELGAKQPVARIADAAGSATDDAPIVQLVNKILTQALARPCVRRPHRAAGRPAAHPVPHRRRAARRRSRCPASMAPGAGQPHEDHGRHEHRRAAPPAGRPVRDRRSTAATSTSASPRSATIWGEKIVLRLLDKSRSLFKLGDLGMPHGHARGLLEADPRAVRHGHLRRPDRQRQDHDALRVAARDQRLARATS